MTELDFPSEKKEASVGGGLPVWSIALIVVGSIVSFGLLLGLIVLILRRQKRVKPESKIKLSNRTGMHAQTVKNRGTGKATPQVLTKFKTSLA